MHKLDSLQAECGCKKGAPPAGSAPFSILAASLAGEPKPQEMLGQALRAVFSSDLSPVLPPVHAVDEPTIEPVPLAAVRK